jgi:hypothetical protein
VAGGGKLPIWGRVVTGILLLPMAHLMFLTGSRAGALMSMISLLCFFRSRVWVGAVAAAIIFAAYALFLDEEQQAATDRITSLEDTRSHVWEAQWNTFLQYPVFGAPVVGERLGFGENSWLALIATAGSLGAAVLVWLLVAIARELRDLWRARRAPGRSSLPFDFCIAGLVSLFVGSFLEAYLLGIITLPILALMLFSASSERLVSGSVVSKPKRLRKVAPALRSRRKEETVAGSHSRP